jgi:hypothetical protein
MCWWFVAGASRYGNTRRLSGRAGHRDGAALENGMQQGTRVGDNEWAFDFKHGREHVTVLHELRLEEADVINKKMLHWVYHMLV